MTIFFSELYLKLNTSNKNSSISFFILKDFFCFCSLSCYLLRFYLLEFLLFSFSSYFCSLDSISYLFW